MRLASLALLVALAGCAGSGEPVITIPAEPDTGNVLRQGDLSVPDGVYEVGPGLAPGAYRTDGAATDLPLPSCNWKRFRAGGQGLVASGSSTGPTTIVIEPTDGAFESRGCRPWLALR